MKNVFFFLFILLPFTGMASPYKDISLLKEHDWFKIEVTGYYPYTCYNVQENVPWRTENIRKLVLKATVMKKTEQELSLGYHLEYFTDCWNDSVKPGFYYYDSRYEKDFSDKTNEDIDGAADQINYIPNEYFVCTTYNITDGSQVSWSSPFQNLHYDYFARYISSGVQVEGNKNEVTFQSANWNLDAFPSVVARTFIAQWSENKEMPMRMTPNISSYFTAEVRIIEASFELPANVQLTYLNPKAKDKKQKTQSCSFFIHSPQSYEFAGRTWLVTPGDSIVLTENKQDELHFSGRGAAQNRFLAEKEKNGYALQVYNFTSSETIETYLQKWNAVYDSLYVQYAGDTDPFWQTSFKLTQKYYHDYLELMNYIFVQQAKPEKSAINWSSKSFATVSPFTDYAYMPDYYGDFLNAFVQYKAKQLANDNLTAIKSYWGNYTNLYYLQKQILTGYPRYKANADVLDVLMRKYYLRDIEREYNEFVSECPDSRLIEQVEKQHALLMKIEPGTYIQDSRLFETTYAYNTDYNNYMPKFINPLGERFPEGDIYKDGKSYTLISISLIPATYPQFNTEINKFKEMLEKDNLSNHVALRLYRQEMDEDSLLTDSEKALFTFLPEQQINEYLNQVIGGTSLTLLVRNDGKIIYRSLDPFDIPFARLTDLIKNDINKQEPVITGPSFFERLIKWFFTPFLVGGITVFIWGRIKQKREKAKRFLVQLELKAIRSQMNPHFIFNALNSIQNLITRSDIDLANQYLLNFAKLLRMVLSSSEKRLVSLSEEIEQLRLYLSLEQLRLPFQVNIETDPSLEPELIEIPGMLIQPLVENAVKHAITPQGGGEIDIHFSKTDSLLKVIVTDNGPGFDLRESSPSSGFGLKAINDRLKLLQDQYHTKIAIQIENRENEGTSGCRITLTIPIE